MTSPRALLTLALPAVLAVGCGGGDDAASDAGVVLDGGSTPDLCACAPDMAQCTSHPAGAACTRDDECCPSWWTGHRTATCVRETVAFRKKIAWPDGYCAAACRPNKNNQLGFNVTDCPAPDSVCAQDGRCMAPCTSASDCRAGYVCSKILGTPLPVCVPAALSDCDPIGDPVPTGRSCAPGDRCQSNSPDSSLGFCFTPCDPVAQGCPDAGGRCVALVQTPDGAGECWNQWTTPAQDFVHCSHWTDCYGGYHCVEGLCRRYCRTGTTDAGFVPGGCPMGVTCRDLVVRGQVILFHADQLGVCLP